MQLSRAIELYLLLVLIYTHIYFSTSFHIPNSIQQDFSHPHGESKFIKQGTVKLPPDPKKSVVPDCLLENAEPF